MPKSTYLDNAMLASALLNTPFTPPVTVYVALYTAAPTIAGGGTEVTGGSYARQVVTFTSPTLGQVSNSVSVTFPIASAPWGTIVAFGILDAVSSGNLLYFANLSASRTVLTNDQVVFPSGQLICTES